MPTARSKQISLLNTPYYHCVSRCVRRAFLCGKDYYSGQSYEHRRQWVEKRIHLLSQVFTIDVCAYAVMSNHTHLVLHINADKACKLSDKQVVNRWHKLFRGTLLTKMYLQGKFMSPLEISSLNATILVWRKRLCDISWFMRSLNEYIARKANKEDNCTGRFWEGRFKSQALLGEAALAACMAYVDLNPIRSNIADTPETSNYTSIKYRIDALVSGQEERFLYPFVGNSIASELPGLPFALNEYIKLVEFTGRKMHPDKPGMIDNFQPSILSRLKLKDAQWNELTTKFENCFTYAAGSEKELLGYKKRWKLKRIAKFNVAKRLFSSL